MTDNVTGAEMIAMRDRLRDEGRLIRMSNRDGLVLQEILTLAETYLAGRGELERFWATVREVKRMGRS